MSEENSVLIPDIDAELKELWKQHKEQKKVRACLFNLVIYTQEERRKDYFKDIITNLIKKSPCRIIFIQRDLESNKDFIEVKVSSETYSEGGTTYACDQITIKVGGKHIERVANLVSPHLVPDLPVYLFWGQDPTQENLILPQLLSYSSRLMFDTECTRDLQKFSKEMLQKLDSWDVEVMDIQWAQLGPWRDVLIQVFSTEDRVEHLRYPEEIIIRYNDVQSNLFHHRETQALYFQAWLAIQLGWTVEDAEKEEHKITIRYHIGDKKLNVILLPADSSDLQSGAIVGVEVGNGSSTHYSLQRQENVRKVIVHISTEDLCLLPFSLPLPNLKLGFNFMKELFYESTSEHYRNVLKQLSYTNWSNIYK